MQEYRLLLYDRNPNDRVYLERLLMPSIPSIRITQAAEIAELREQLRPDAFDVAIVESSMGIVNAIAAFREIHKSSASCTLIYLSDATPEIPMRWEGGPEICVFPRGDVERILSLIKSRCLKKPSKSDGESIPPAESGAVNGVEPRDWPSAADYVAAKGTFDRNFEIVSLVDGAGLITNIRDSHVLPLGYERAEILGQEIFSLIHPKDLARTRNAFKKILSKPDHSETVICRAKTKEGGWRWLETVGINKLDDSAMRAILLNSRDITERKLQERALTDAATALVHLEGKEFFDFAASSIAQMLGVEIAAFTELVPAEQWTSRTVAIWMDGGLQPSMDLPLPGSPCEEAIKRKLCCYPRNVARAFPGYEPLKQIRGEAYVGLPLHSESGSVIGMAWVVSRREIKRTKLVKSVLQIFSAKAAVELQKMRTGRVSKDDASGQDMFRRIIELADEMVMVASPDGAIRYSNSQAANATGFSNAELAKKRLADVIVPAQHDALAAASKSALSGTPQDLEVEIQDREGRRSAYAARVVFEAPTGLVFRFRKSSADRSIIEELRAKTIRQDALIKVGEHLLSESGFAASLRRVCAIVASAVGADASGIWVESVDRIPILTASHGWSEEARNQPVSNSASDPVHNTISNHITTIVDDFGSESRFSRPKPFAMMETQSSVSVPYLQADGTYGALCVLSRRPGSFLHLDVNFLESAARILAAASQRAGLDGSRG